MGKKVTEKMAIPGYHGRVLDIDLSTGNIKSGALTPEDILLYLGGRGLATKLFFDRMEPAADPLGPDNVIIIASSPLVGSQAPTAIWGYMVFKSPLTGYLGGCNLGGNWGRAFKASGYDAIIINGCARQPVFIDLSPEKIEIRHASHLRGKNISESINLLTSQSPGSRPCQALVIGPAGENLVKYATVASDKYSLYNRGGSGAVFGSKNLKGIRVCGEEKIRISDKARYQASLDQANYLLKQSPITRRLMRELGTAGFVLLARHLNMLPHRNFLDAEPDVEKVKAISGEAIARCYLEKADSCYECPIACLRQTAIKTNDACLRCGQGPEYETVAMMGSACDIYDLDCIIRASYLAGELGLDAVSFGGTVACAMELAEKGYLTSGQSGDLELKFGRSELLEKLVELTAYRRGSGHLLAEGSYRLASACGHPELAMQVKKLEIPGYDPRASYAQALGYMTSPTGACHRRGGYAASLSLLGGNKGIPRFSLFQSPITIRNLQNTGIIQDSLGVCYVTGFAFGVEPWSRIVSSITGYDFSAARLEEIANRVASLERLFNLQAGLNPEEEGLLPSRFAEIPIMSEGKPRAISRENMLQMCRDYYRARGWNGNGRPGDSYLKAMKVEPKKAES
ncbi:MAG: aldehyde ferredoxin oxidoreductase family protein [Acidobacteriota bacterium]|nr:aldehyde ferredoxin oxidoreductase family protein [Acidobacteriota bacterium]